jgi:hypothetical protein
VRKFEYKEGETELSHGQWGWIPKGMPFDPCFDSITMGHDVLEHFNQRDTGLDAEMMAFGAMLYLRVEPDYWNVFGVGRRVDPAQNIAADIGRFIMDDLFQEQHVSDPGRTYRLSDELEQVLFEMQQHVISEWKETDNFTSAQFAEARQSLTNTVGWIRRGYRKAARRFKLEVGERLDLWYQVEQRCAEFLNPYQSDHANYEMLNAVLTVTVDTERCTCNFKIKEWRDPYDY